MRGASLAGDPPVSYQVDVYTDEHTQQTRLEDDVRRGLTAPRKSLPPKYFYDRTGSMLFERITLSNFPVMRISAIERLLRSSAIAFRSNVRCLNTTQE